ncbi:MAG TPA: Xaa-Pro peptidase family protein [Gaiellaceae bacterium]
MPDVLIYAATSSPDMRHEVPIGIPDPFLYVEHGGERHVVLTSFEIDRVAAIPAGPTPHAYEEFGYDELLEQKLAREEVLIRVAINACKALGVTDAAVPATFPAIFADRLRAEGLTLTPEYDLFYDRRRVKSEVELAGIRRAQRAAEAGMDAARDLLRRASPDGAGLEVDGEPLTSERIKAAIATAFAARGMVADEFIVSHGPQSAVGHDMGSGTIAAGEPVVIDLWPRDIETACYADMTRTYVVGEPSDEIVRYQALCKEALDRSLSAIRPGVPGEQVFALVCDLFHEAGQPTQLSKQPGEVLEDGFYHGLGHGVGLEVHEHPSLGREPGELVTGDVVTVEPGLYRHGYGGVRLEDLVLVTEDGAENLTEYPYDLAP